MIEFKDMSYAYINGEGGIKNVNLKIKEGEFVVLCGKSGCGKTTMIRIINGLAFHYYKGKYRGDAYLNGNSISELPSNEICLSVGSVFQDPRSQFFDKYVEGEVAFGCENIGQDSKTIRENVDMAIKTLSIDALKTRSLFELSSGEKQKTAIASIYAMNPNVYVLDEPSSNLDQAATEELACILKKLKSQGKTIVIAEHRINYLTEIADRFVYINNGEIEAEFSPTEFMSLTEEQLSSRGLRCSHKPKLKEEIAIKKNQQSGYFEIAGLSGGYKKPLFSDLSLAAELGDIIAVVGSNGKGKTTLCRLLSGLKRAKSGKIKLNGINLSKSKRLKKFFLVLNGSDNRTFTTSVSEEPFFGFSKNEIRQRQADCDILLKDLNLFHLADRHPLTLSGGQKQRLSIATALMQNREVIILDEPTSGLDYENMQQVSKAIKLAAQKGKIIIIVSHDIEFINECCFKIYELR